MIMRNKFAVTVGLTDTQVLGPNPRRIKVIFSPPVTNRYTIGIGDEPAVLDSGITVPPGSQPFTLDCAGAMGEGIRAISAVAPQVVSGVEIFEACPWVIPEWSESDYATHRRW
jgi:hypothetical protein